MRKWLKTLSPSIVVRIALDQGYTSGNAIEFIIEQAKTYRWNIQDLKSRYGLE